MRVQLYAVVPDNISNDEKLQLYALFKQSTVGDVNTGTPDVILQLGAADNGLPGCGER